MVGVQSVISVLVTVHRQGGGGGKGWMFFKYQLKNLDLPQIPEQ